MFQVAPQESPSSGPCILPKTPSVLTATCKEHTNTPTQSTPPPVPPRVPFPQMQSQPRSVRRNHRVCLSLSCSYACTNSSQLFTVSLLQAAGSSPIRGEKAEVGSPRLQHLNLEPITCRPAIFQSVSYTVIWSGAAHRSLCHPSC